MAASRTVCYCKQQLTSDEPEQCVKRTSADPRHRMLVLVLVEMVVNNENRHYGRVEQSRRLEVNHLM